MVISLLGTVSACTRKVVNFDGRSCDNAGGCNTGYICRPTDKTCVPVFNCDNDCRAKIYPSSSCETVGQVLPCGDNTNNCELGCRVCGSGVGGQWGICLCGPGSKIGDTMACSTCNDDCTAKVKFAEAACANTGLEYACTHGACEAGHYDADGDPTNGCEAVPEPEVCNGKDDDFNGLIDDGNVCVPTVTPSEPSALLYQEPVGTDPDTNLPTFALYRVQADGSNRLAVAVPALDTVSVTDFAISPDKKWVAYTMNGRPKPLWVATLVGTGGPKVVSQGLPVDGAVGAYVWASDSLHIAYVASTGACTGCVGLYSVTPSGGAAPVRLDGGEQYRTIGEESSIVWDPAGLMVAFNADPVGMLNARETHVASVGTGLRAKLSSTGTNAAGRPSWSSDGNYVAFWQGTDTAGYGLFVFSRDASASTSIVTRDMYEALALAWRPNGGHLAFAGVNSDGVVEIDTYDPSLPGTFNNVGHESASLTQLMWSPDGSLLAYLSDSNNEATYQALYLALPTGGSSSRLITGTLSSSTTVRDVRWSPDSSFLSYLLTPLDATTAGALYTVPTSPGATPTLVNARVARHTMTTSTEETSKWSRDGRIAYYGQNAIGNLALFVAAAGDASGGTEIASATIVSFVWSLENVPRHIAFLGIQNSTSVGLYTATLDGSTLKQVSPGDKPSLCDSTMASCSLYGWLQ